MVLTTALFDLSLTMADITVETIGNITCVSGSLPYDVKDMIPVSKHESFVSIDKIREKYHPIMPNKINWAEVTSSDWFICIRPNDDYNYSFPIMESENRENNFRRAKAGLAHFHEMKFLTFNIGR